jgi:hypothetical protein
MRLEHPFIPYHISSEVYCVVVGVYVISIDKVIVLIVGEGKNNKNIENNILKNTLMIKRKNKNKTIKKAISFQRLT